jgi:hypothetical protein
VRRGGKIAVAVYAFVFAFGASVGAMRARIDRVLLADVVRDPYVETSALAFAWGSASDARASLQRAIDHLDVDLKKDPEARNGFAKADLRWVRINLAAMNGTLLEVEPACAAPAPDGGVMLKKGACENWAKRRRVK